MVGFEHLPFIGFVDDLVFPERMDSRRRKDEAEGQTDDFHSTIPGSVFEL
jgi:hypothetical protein